jgi:hypothetical protein
MGESMRLISTLFFAGLLGSAALAQDVGGLYRVEGTNANGSAYGGTAEIIITSPNTCRIVWEVGSTSSGICMRNSNAVAAAYELSGVVGLIIYELMADGSMEGIWTIADQEGVGTEVLTPMN